MALLDRLFSQPRNETISESRDLDDLLRRSNRDTWSGDSVGNERDLNRLVSAYAAIRVVANTVAQAPMAMFRMNEDMTRRRITDHNLVRVLQRPNALQSNFRFRKTMQAQTLMHGYAIAEKVRVSGQLTELRPYPTSRVRIRTDEMTDEFAPIYDVYIGPPQAREIVTFRHDQLLVLVGESINGITGFSPINEQFNTLSLTKSTEKHAAHLFKNGAQFSGVLQHPNKLSDTAYGHLKESFDEENTGTDKAWKVFIAEEGMEFAKIGMTSEESQFLQSRQFQVIEIARMFGVPPHLLFELSRATFSNIEHQSLEFVKYFIQPHWENWEQELAISLLPRTRLGELFFEHDPTRLLRGDTKAVTDEEVRHAQWGIRTRNEIRIARGWQPIEGLDEPLTPSNMDTDDDDDEPNEDEPLREAPTVEPEESGRR